MMKGLTELVFILDRSGSMQPLTQDTIGGFNAMLEKQKQAEGEAIVSTVLFNEESYVLYDRVDLKRVKPMTAAAYMPGGMTALTDAIGGAIRHIRRVQSQMPEAIRPEHTLFVITTDGLENASRKYSADTVRSMVREQTENGWEFIFLGANIDAVETARSYGIDESRAANYHPDAEGTRCYFNAAANAVESIRFGGSLNCNWKDEVENDYNSRMI